MLDTRMRLVGQQTGSRGEVEHVYDKAPPQYEAAPEPKRGLRIGFLTVSTTAILVFNLVRYFGAQ